MRRGALARRLRRDLSCPPVAPCEIAPSNERISRGVAAWEKRMRAIPAGGCRPRARAQGDGRGPDLADGVRGPDGCVHWRDSRLEWPVRHGFVDFIAREFHAGKMMFPPDAVVNTRRARTQAQASPRGAHRCRSPTSRARASSTTAYTPYRWVVNEEPPPWTPLDKAACAMQGRADRARAACSIAISRGSIARTRATG